MHFQSSTSLAQRSRTDDSIHIKTDYLQNNRMRPDAGYAWLVLFACVIFNYVSIGFAYAVIGPLLPEYNKHFQVELTESSWVGSVLAGFVLCGGPFAGFLVSRFGCRIVAIAAIFTHIAGLIGSAFATRILHVTLSFGVLSGFACSCCHIVTLQILTQWFNKYQHMAYAAAFCGCDIASISMPFITNALLSRLDYRFSILSLAAIVSAGIPCAFVFRSPSTDLPEESIGLDDLVVKMPVASDTQAEPKEAPSHTNMAVDLSNGIVDHVNELPQADKHIISNNNITIDKSVDDNNEIPVVQADQETPKSKTIVQLLVQQIVLLKIPIILIFLWNCFLFNVAGSIMTVLTYDFYVSDNQYSHDAASIGMTVYGAGSLSGSLLLAVIASVYKSNNGLLVHISANVILFGAQLIFPFVKMDHRALSALVAVFGFGYGLICANLGSVIDHLNGDYLLHLVYGYQMFAAGLGNFIGPVTGAALNKALALSESASIFGSVCSLIGIVTLISYCLFNREIYIPIKKRNS